MTALRPVTAALFSMVCAGLIGATSSAPAAAAPLGLPDTGSSGSSSTGPVQFPWDPDPRLWVEFLGSSRGCASAYFERPQTELCTFKVRYADAGNVVNKSFSNVNGDVSFEGSFVRLRTAGGAYIEGNMTERVLVVSKSDVPGLAKAAPGELKFDFEYMFDTRVGYGRYAFREQGDDHDLFPG